MTESGLGGRFWFKSAVAGCDARNTTYKEQIGTTPWRTVKKGICPDFAHLVAGHVFTSTQKDDKRVNICRELLKQSILDLSPTLARIYSLFRKRTQ